MDEKLAREWILQAVRTGHVEPMEAATLLTSGVRQHLGLVESTSQIAAPPAAVREVCVLDLRDVAPGGWADRIHRSPALPTAVVVGALDQTDAVDLYCGVLSLVQQWLQRAQGTAKLRLIATAAILSPAARATAALFASMQKEEITVWPSLLVGAGEHQLQRALRETGPVAPLLRCEGDDRWTATTRVVELELTDVPVPWRQGGTYLVSGGSGALGLAMARRLARLAHARVVLLGRRPAEQMTAALESVRALSGDVSYRQIDLAAASATADLTGLVAELGQVHGVLHCAGTTRDALMRFADPDNAKAVVAPKVNGFHALDAATAGCELDFFVSYSSISGVLGSAGQTGYAFANAYVDQLSVDRAELVQAGRRHGTSVSIAWPFWTDGGITIPADVLAGLEETTGIASLPTWLGLGLAEASIALGRPNIAPVVGTRPWPQSDRSAPTAEWDDDVQDAVVTTVMHALAQSLEIEQDAVDPDALMTSYGLDSVLVARLRKNLSGDLGELPVSLFFDSRTCRELGETIAQRWPAECRRALGGAPTQHQATPTPKPRASGDTATPSPGDQIAIIGCSVRSAAGDALDDLWSALLAGADLVTEFPADRRMWWGADRPADVDERDWHQAGSFLDDPWGFDHDFFNVSPREARGMDPQERLALEEVWHAFEDAGLSRDALAELDARGGVAVHGAMTNHSYEQLAVLPLTPDSYRPQSSGWSLANRISAFFDLHGPSLTVDTGCSSALVALAQACDRLQLGHSPAAVVVASNLYLSPSKFATLRERSMLSPSGRCHAFGADADGFVPAEAVAALVLKPLAAARADGDRVLAVVSSWAVNHGGTTHGYSVPSPAAQAAVMTTAIARSGTAAGEVGYVETHGTGTSLGDPIEIDGLLLAYGSQDRREPLKIGSVKSNLGHTEAAAGLVSLIKVLAQLQHGWLAPSIHAARKNSALRLDPDVLTVVEEPEPWRQRPEDRVAGVSSFGAGGTNAHVLLHGVADPVADRSASTQARAFVFSAAEEAALQQLAQRYAAWLEREEVDLASLESALAWRRTHLSERAAILAETAAQLIAGLSALAAGGTSPAVLTGSLREPDAAPTGSAASDGSLAGQVRLWLRGGEVTFCRRLPIGSLRLPGYPFQRRCCRVEIRQDPTPADARVQPSTSLPAATGPRLSLLNFVDDVPHREYGDAAGFGEVVHLSYPEDGVALVRMDHERAANTMDSAMYEGLCRAFASINSDDAVRCVVITGTDRLFNMGGARGSLADIAQRDQDCADGPLFYLGLPSLRVPVVAAATGHAFGGGLGFALSAEITLMAEDSLYAATFMDINFTPGVGSTYYFPKRLGMGAAHELFLTTQPMTGQELGRLSPALRVLPRTAVLPTALRLAHHIAQKPLEAVMAYKAMTVSSTLPELEACVAREVATQSGLLMGDIARQAQEKIALLFPEATEPAAAAATAAPRNGGAAAATGTVLLSSPGVVAPPQPAPAAPAAPAAVQLAPLGGPSRPSGAVQVAAPLAGAALGAGAHDRDELVQRVVAILASVLRADPTKLDLRRSPSDLGLDSVGVVELSQALGAQLGRTIGSEQVYASARAVDFAESVADLLLSDSAPQPAAGTAAAPQSRPEASAPVSTAVARPPHPLPPPAPAPVTRPAGDTPAVAAPTAPTGRVTEAVLETALVDVLRLPTGRRPDLRRSLSDLGLDSVSGLELVTKLNSVCGTTLAASDLYSYGRAIDLVSSPPVSAPAPLQPTDPLDDALTALANQQISVDAVLLMLEGRR